jgi:twitching motility two-component system response regulator PilH
MALILVVDDTFSTRELFRAICEHAGHQVLEATSGQEALHLARTHRPHLIITDIYMRPMTGLELLDTLRHDTQVADIPVIVTSMTMADGHNASEALRLGATQFLSGPIEVRPLITAIEAALRP